MILGSRFAVYGLEALEIHFLLALHGSASNADGSVLLWVYNLLG